MGSGPLPRTPFVYSLFGLRLHADRAIPGLAALPGLPEADVEVWLGLMPPWPDRLREAAQPPWYVSPYRDDRGDPVSKVWQLAGGAYFRLLYSEGAEFLVDRSGREIWARWPDTLTLEDAAAYLVGPVLGFVLRLRGIVSLHASAIGVDDRAIAFLGPEGAGKSTTAAALASRGYPVLSDDLVALSDESAAFLAYPGFPWLRLRPASVGVLSDATRARPGRLTPTSDRLYLDLDLTGGGYHFQRQPLPLAAIYVLDERCADPAAPFVEAMPAADALMALIANTWATRLLDRTMRAREFGQLARVAGAVRLRRVKPHRDPASLSRLCDVILADLGRRSARSSPPHAVQEASVRDAIGRSDPGAGCERRSLKQQWR